MGTVGKVNHALGVSFGVQQFADTLSGQKLPAEWTSSISDSKRVIAARSTSSDKFTGTSVNPEILQRMPMADEAAFESVMKEGFPALLVYSRSPVSRWSVAIAIPLRIVQADLWHNLALLAIGAALLFAAIIGLRGTVQDITERKRNALELERHRLHLEELVASRTEDLVAAKVNAESATQAKGARIAVMKLTGMSRVLATAPSCSSTS